MIYRYRAKKGPSEIVEGVVEAQTEVEAVENVSRLGFFPLSVQLEKSQGPQHDFFHPIARIRAADITIFTRQLASLLKSGVPILQSLNILAEQSDNNAFRLVLVGLHGAIKEGGFFSASLQKFPRLFPPLYVALISAGEGSGSLPEALLRIAEYRSKQEEFISRFKSALAYPVLMMVVGVATIIFMLTFVIPRLTKILVTMGQSLPVPTQLLISISQALGQWWLWVVIALFGLILYRQMHTEAMRLPVARMKLRIPVFGIFVLKSELACFSRTLELLIKNGIPILRALEITIPVLDNEAIKQQLMRSCKELEQGGSFGRSLKSSKLFPPFMSNLIIVGEESGRIAEALSEIGSSYERDTDAAVKTLISLMEPLMILGMGAVVGFIVIAMLLPIFEINTMAR
jgi:general secretion pathway protein F